MASGLSNVCLLALLVTLAPGALGGSECESYRDRSNLLQPSQKCWIGFCCGDCQNRYCCTDSFKRLTGLEQEYCPSNSNYFDEAPIVGLSIGFIIFTFAIIICCCVCPCCCLYKICRKPRPVVATTTLVTSGAQHYPQQQTAAPGLPYQQYPPYQPIPAQPGYPAQPMPQGAAAQNMPTPYPGQPIMAGPPPTYQEATGPGYPVAPYGQAAFTPGKPAYPIQPPVQPQPSYPQPSHPQPSHPQPGYQPAQTDFLAQPAYNPDFVAPPP